jgi:hypothetical protein
MARAVQTRVVRRERGCFLLAATQHQTHTKLPTNTTHIQNDAMMPYRTQQDAEKKIGAKATGTSWQHHQTRPADSKTWHQEGQPACPIYPLARHQNRHYGEGAITACLKKPSVYPSAIWSLPVVMPKTGKTQRQRSSTNCSQTNTNKRKNYIET